MSYIKKGAIIGGILGLVGIIYTIIIMSPDTPNLLFFISIPFSIISVLLAFSGIFGCEPKGASTIENEFLCNLTMYFGHLLTVICFILLGVIIGWLIGKIKSRQKSNNL